MNKRGLTSRITFEKIEETDINEKTWSALRTINRRESFNPIILGYKSDSEKEIAIDLLNATGVELHSNGINARQVTSDEITDYYVTRKITGQSNPFLDFDALLVRDIQYCYKVPSGMNGLLELIKEWYCP